MPVATVQRTSVQKIQKSSASHSVAQSTPPRAAQQDHQDNGKGKAKAENRTSGDSKSKLAPRLATQQVGNGKANIENKVSGDLQQVIKPTQHKTSEVLRDSSANNGDAHTEGGSNELPRATNKQYFGPQFKPFGIEAYRTDARKHEICLDFVDPRRRCLHGRHCFRIHPLDWKFYHRKRYEPESAYLFRKEMSHDRSSTTSSGDNSSVAAKPPLDATESISPEDSTNKPGWDPATGQWNFVLDWCGSSSSSEVGKGTITSRKRLPSAGSSETEDEDATRRRSYSKTGASKPTAVCRKWLRNQCRLDSKCRFLHSRPSEANSSSDEESPTQTKPLNSRSLAPHAPIQTSAKSRESPNSSTPTPSPAVRQNRPSHPHVQSDSNNKSREQSRTPIGQPPVPIESRAPHPTTQTNTKSGENRQNSTPTPSPAVPHNQSSHSQVKPSSREQSQTRLGRPPGPTESARTPPAAQTNTKSGEDQSSTPPAPTARQSQSSHSQIQHNSDVRSRAPSRRPSEKPATSNDSEKRSTLPQSSQVPTPPPIRPAGRVQLPQIAARDSVVPISTTENTLLDPRINRPSRPTDDCTSWLQGKCWKGRACRFRHRDISAIEPTVFIKHGITPPSINGVSTVDPTGPRRPRPPYKDTCIKWLRGECIRDYECDYTHGDLDYDSSIPARKVLPVPYRTPPETISKIVHKHIKVKISDGFEVTQVTTGFETSWLYVGNIPKGTTEAQISRVLKEHGELIDLRMPAKQQSSLFTVKARYASSTEAAKASSTLNGLETLRTTLTARLSLSNSGQTTVLKDTSVRITWEMAMKPAYGGYTTRERAQEAVDKCRDTPLRGEFWLKAAIHVGIPACGKFTVKFEGVPADTERALMKEFAQSDDLVWGQPNYTGFFDYAKHDIERMLRKQNPEILTFEPVPGPYRHGILAAWAHFSTRGEAKACAERFNFRKPRCTGNTRIYVRHIQTLEYSLTPDTYAGAKQAINDFVESTRRESRDRTVTVHTAPGRVTVKLSADDLKDLSRLKGELDVMISGEVVRDNGKVVWDEFFRSVRGLEFVASLGCNNLYSKVRIDRHRKEIRLFGTLFERVELKKKISEKVAELQKERVTTILVDGSIIGLFFNQELDALSRELGEDNVFLDLWNLCLRVRGDKHAVDTVRDALIRVRRTKKVTQKRKEVLCPVCFDEVSSPVTLCCGHSWCTTCLTRYLTTAIDQKFFPLTCLGDEAKCKEKIPISCISQQLSSAEFESLVESAYTAYIQRHPADFAYCPTPDCQQVYRPTPRPKLSPSSSAKPSSSTQNPGQSSSAPTQSYYERGYGCPSASTSTSAQQPKPSSEPETTPTFLQCPSCLARICSTCQAEAHDGLACPPTEEQTDILFEEWMQNNNVKTCPGCKMPIEKVAGCHHVTCVACETHLCWVCLTPFPNGSGVYSHMLAMHGSFV